MTNEEFPFKVVRTNLLMGRAAFETAKRLYPKDAIWYRKGAKVLDRSGEGGA